jgi:hypothetical protein
VIEQTISRLTVTEMVRFIVCPVHCLIT